MSSFLNAFLSLACLVGLILAISMTISADGSTLLKGCNSTNMPVNARSPVIVNCPFDATRIYVSQKCMWCFWNKLNINERVWTFILYVKTELLFLLQDTTLALWFTCSAFTSLEAGLSVWCFIVGLQLRGIGPCAQNYIREQVHLSIFMQTAQLNEPAV